MPSLATLRPEASDEWPLLCHLIHEAAETLATSDTEEANLMQLVTTLLKVMCYCITGNLHLDDPV